MVKISYREFLDRHPEDGIWHGRLKDYTKEDRARVGAYAEIYARDNKPYQFFNLNLADESGFYCSKLPWLCVYKVLNISLDDKSTDGFRLFWFTPKMMLASKAITVLEPPTAPQFTVPGNWC